MSAHDLTIYYFILTSFILAMVNVVLIADMKRDSRIERQEKERARAIGDEAEQTHRTARERPQTDGPTA